VLRVDCVASESGLCGRPVLELSGVDSCCRGKRLGICSMASALGKSPAPHYSISDALDVRVTFVDTPQVFVSSPSCGPANLAKAQLMLPRPRLGEHLRFLDFGMTAWVHLPGVRPLFAFHGGERSHLPGRKSGGRM
jgi:hypothetical protein